ncbi:MAG TPA: AsmA-like C-terminal region-containing protein [Terracidiphilus sp.]|jgi:hypothetical protein|nr:AsmA-like C-terminal region-containing protein [Terracidiphilus sp.]
MHTLETAPHPPVPTVRRGRFRLSPRARRWLAAAGFVLLAGVMIGIWFVGQNWPFRYRKIHPLLEDVFGSQVIISHYHRTYFPHPGFIATGLTIRRKSAPDQPPIGTVTTFFVQGKWTDLFMLRDRVLLVDMTGVHLVLPPPGSRAAEEDFPAGSSSNFTGPETAIASLQVHDSVLDVLRGNGKRFKFPIRWLRLEHMHRGQAMAFAVDMDNAIPWGRILAAGSFGPLNASSLGETPVSGSFTFDHVNLSDVGELHGTLASSGRFNGKLDALDAQAQTETPDFAVKDGHATSVSGAIECTVNGTNGDVAYRSLEARTGGTVVRASGSTAGNRGKSTHLDIAVQQGRAEDVMRPFLKRPVPIAGPVMLHARAYLEPMRPDRGFLDRLHLDGAFDVPAERLANADMRNKLSTFSRRAQGHKVPDPPKGSSEPGVDAISSVEGPATIEKGIVHTSNLRFQVAGASARLSGTFNFHTSAVHLTGKMTTNADLSDVTTGFKSFLLEAIDPLFRHHRKHGAVVPIAVTGTPGRYSVTQNFRHSK